MFRVPGFELWVVLIAVLLSGCTVAPHAPEKIEPSFPFQAHANQENFQITGRIAVQYDGQGFSGGLRWRHTAAADEILLSSPLGQGVAQIVRDESGVTLVNAADQQTYHAQNAEELTEGVLGWRLPLSGMVYWVRGKPAPGINQPRYEAGQLVRLDQDGWQIDYLGHSQISGEPLPRKIFLQRGDLDIRLVIDEWGTP